MPACLQARKARKGTQPRAEPTPRHAGTQGITEWTVFISIHTHGEAPDGPWMPLDGGARFFFLRRGALRMLSPWLVEMSRRNAVAGSGLRRPSP